MGQIPGNLANAKNIGEAAPGDLSGSEKTTKGMLGGLAGGLQAYGQGAAKPPQGGMQAPIQMQQPQFVDFSQMGRPKNSFYGS